MDATRVQGFLTALTLSAALATGAQAIDEEIGTECGTCQFPTAVRMPLCSGVYMGHGLVITAGHCVDNVHEGVSRAYFGEDADDAAFSAVLASCTAHPNGSVDGDGYEGVDLGYCILDDSEGLPNLPIVPPMIPTGCERDWLAHQVYEMGAPPLVTSLGSGCAFHYTSGSTWCGVDGIKRYLTLQLVAQSSYGGSSTKLELERWGDLETGILDGDSGGPVFDVLPDGTWRLLGVHHGTNVALKAAFAEAVPPYLHWIEADSGIDITPCHDFTGGGWVTNGACAGELPLDPEKSGASWENACPSALGGGGVGLAKNFCPGFPWQAGDKKAPSAEEPVLPAEVFSAAADLVLAGRNDPPATRAALVADLAPLAVFPFLAPALPGTVPLSYLSDDARLREAARTKSARR